MFTVESTQSTEHGWITTMKLGSGFVAFEGTVEDFIIALQRAMRLMPAEYTHRARYEIEAYDDSYGPDGCYCNSRLNITYERPATAEEIAVVENKNRDWQAQRDAQEYMQYERLRAKFAGYGRNGR